MAVKARLCAACGAKKAGGRSLIVDGADGSPLNAVDICADCLTEQNDAVDLILGVMAQRAARKHSGGYLCSKTGGFVDMHEARCPYCGDENPNYGRA